MQWLSPVGSASHGWWHDGPAGVDPDSPGSLDCNQTKFRQGILLN